jgi:hypothetical protein
MTRVRFVLYIFFLDCAAKLEPLMPKRFSSDFVTFSQQLKCSSSTGEGEQRTSAPKERVEKTPEVLES